MHSECNRDGYIIVTEKSNRGYKVKKYKRRKFNVSPLATDNHNRIKYTGTKILNYSNLTSISDHISSLFESKYHLNLT